MSRMPGAQWFPHSIGNRARRSKGRAVVLHVAVSEAQNLQPGPNADWHFYVAKDGVIYQYIDTDYQAWATAGGNGSVIAVETQGGVTNPDSEPWTDAQVHSLAAICRWAHDDEGVPLTAMPDSRPASRGVGYHKLGVKPWVVSGGEVWSSSAGKVCPGAAKIAQVPQIIALASSQEDDMTPEQDNLLRDIQARLRGDTSRPYDMLQSIQAIADRVEAIAARVEQRLITDPGDDHDRLRDVWGEIEAIRGDLAKLTPRT
jgi:hypothetical protein